LNLPDVPVSDLIVQDNELAISTHGRGFWILDNIGPLRQTGSAVDAADAYLYEPPAAYRTGPGASFTYLLRKAAKQVTVDVLDSTGKLVKSFGPDTAPPAAAGRGGGGGRGGFATPAPAITAGMNRVNWDMRYESAKSFPGMILWGASVAGPAAPPGTYQVRLTVDGVSQTQKFKIKRNPMITDVTDADLRAQFALAIKIRDRVSEANQSVIDLRSIKAQVADRLKKSSDVKLKETGDKLTASSADVEDDIYQVKNQAGQDPLNFPIRINNRMANLLRMVTAGEGRPTNNLPTLFNEYNALLKVQTDRRDKVFAVELAAFNAELKRLGMIPVDPKCTKAEGCSFVP
jgi:hypothetical protein